MFNLIKLMIFFILLMNLIINLINKFNLNKMKKNFFNSIECGFNQMNNKHSPLFNNFFIIMIIFLIFDLEFFLLIPIMIMIKNFNWIKFNMILILIIMFMYISMMYEIKMNCINWIK